MRKKQWFTPLFFSALIGFGLFGIVLSCTAFYKDESKAVERFRYSITALVFVVMEQVVISVWFACLFSKGVINPQVDCGLIKFLLMLSFYSWLAFLISIKGLITVICSSSTFPGEFCRAVKESSHGFEGPYWTIVSYASNILCYYLVLIGSEDEARRDSDEGVSISFVS